MTIEKTHFRPWRGIARLTAYSLLVTGLFSAGAQAGVYRWTDAKGQVHYGDTLPDTYQRSGASELERDGRIVGHTQSTAERQAAAVKAAEDHIRKREAREQQLQDKALLMTYVSTDEIDDARDRELNRYRSMIENTELRARDIGERLGKLKARNNILKEQGKPVPGLVVGQMKQYEFELAGLKDTIRRFEKEMEGVRDRYADDKARFRELAEQSRQ